MICYPYLSVLKIKTDNIRTWILASGNCPAGQFPEANHYALILTIYCVFLVAEYCVLILANYCVVLIADNTMWLLIIVLLKI